MTAPSSKKKTCPYCEEEIPLAAKVCRFCREELPEAKAARKKKAKAELAKEDEAKKPAAAPQPLPWNEDDGPPTYTVRDEPQDTHEDNEDDEEEEDERPRGKSKRPTVADQYEADRRAAGKRSGYAACPSCGAWEAKRIFFTLWGGIPGPLLLCHVRCQRCRTAYNGRTGNSNTTGIILYVLAQLILGLLIGLGAVLAVIALQQ
jgi:hypothetical protein